jgi:hypothetical protein
VGGVDRLFLFAGEAIFGSSLVHRVLLDFSLGILSVFEELDDGNRWRTGLTVVRSSLGRQCADTNALTSAALLLSSLALLLFLIAGIVGDLVIVGLVLVVVIADGWLDCISFLSCIRLLIWISIFRLLRLGWKVNIAS